MSLEKAYFEIAIEFGQNCTAVVDQTARDAGLEFFRRNFGCLIEQKLMDWDNPKDRDFALGCAAQLGRAARDVAIGSGGIVTAGVLRKAATLLIKDWERRCHLPSSQECGIRRQGQMTGCLTMRSLLGIDDETLTAQAS